MTETSEVVDDQVLALRSEGRSFAAIASTLGLDRPSGAFAAFNRSLRRRPAAERDRIRAEELARLEVLVGRVREGDHPDEDAVARAVRAVEHMRATLLSD